MEVRFIYVNFGSAIPPLEQFVPAPKMVRDVRPAVLAHLQAHAPEYSHLSVWGVRLLCMGQELNDNQTMGTNQVPVFSTHATPVHVMLANDSGSASQIGAQPAGFAGQDGPGRTAPPGCCTIM